MKLSDRLENLISLVPPGTALADIGTDHAFTAIELVRRGICPKVIATDVRKGPLKIAQSHVEEAGLAEKIKLRRGDGLEPLSPGETDGILIAGMGGPLMERILSEGREKAQAAKFLILSPQSEIPHFRVFLQENGYAVKQEKLLNEEGKVYFIFLAEPGEEAPLSETEAAFGRHLLADPTPELEGFILHEKRIAERILDILPGEISLEERRKELERIIRVAQEALDRIRSR
ncbi:MAG: SAM-dependent methyltransferase [Lachnospiraceae bacterium]|nr:SAM-dependent methyltransferase [Lachnospiraceae bacterium]